MKSTGRRAIAIQFFIFLLAAIAAFGWNSWNRNVMRAHPDSIYILREGITVATWDDVSYLKPVEDRILTLKGEEPSGDPIFRPPGYGIWYYLARLFLIPNDALSFVVAFQVLLFAASVAFLGLTLIRSNVAAWIWLPALLLIALLPTFHGFLFYTLTEGVTPALVLIVCCSSMLYLKDRHDRWMVIGAIAWSILTITRPALVWAGLPLVMVVGFPATWNTIKKALGLTFLALLPMLGWLAHEPLTTGGPASLHPVYRPEAVNIFRPTHRAFWELAKSWGMKGDRFHQIMEAAFQSALVCDTSAIHADTFSADAPADHLTNSDRSSIAAQFHAWQRFTCTTHAALIRSGSKFEMNPYQEEQRIVEALDRITSEYRSSHPIHHHVLVPLSVLKDLLFHSNLNLYIFQHTYRGKFWMEALRWFSLIVHTGLLILIFVAPWMSLPFPVRVAAAGALAYVAYLAYIQRGIEERYTLPVLHLSVLLLPFVIQLIATNHFNVINVRSASIGGGTNEL